MAHDRVDAAEVVADCLDGARELGHRSAPAAGSAVARRVERRDPEPGPKKWVGKRDEAAGVAPPAVSAEHQRSVLRTPLVDLDPVAICADRQAAGGCQPGALVGARYRSVGPHEQGLGHRCRSIGGDRFEGSDHPPGAAILLVH
jgi:hypothetical protein